MRIDVNGQVQGMVSRTGEPQHWLAVCDPLGLTMEAPSLDDLHASLSDAVQLLMADLLEAGELDGFLRNPAWRRLPDQSRAPPPGDARVALPVGLPVPSAPDPSRAP